MSLKREPQTAEEFALAKSYLRQIPFLFNACITEYDIRKANINMLKSAGYLSDEEYNQLLILPKDAREREIGYRIRSDYRVQQLIDEGIAWTKLSFLQSNQVDLSTIVRIANDAIYINSPAECMYKIFNRNDHLIEFVPKHRFSTFMNLNNILFFYSSYGDEWDVDVKGISDDKLYLHQNFIEFICVLCDTFYNAGKETAIRYLNDFIQDYLNKRLDIDYYILFIGGDPCWLINMYGGTYKTSVRPYNLDHINIDYNYNVLRKIYSYIIAA